MDELKSRILFTAFFFCTLFFVCSGAGWAQDETAEPPPPGAGEAESAYRLGTGDSLIINVWNKIDLEFPTQDCSVDNDGNIVLPMVGKVNAAGRTVTELTETLVRKYSEFIIEPKIIVKIKEFVFRTVTVLGEVRSPGVYTLDRRRYLMDVIALAGGLTDKASSMVQLFREGNDQVLDISGIARGDTSSNIEILPGDRVVVLANLDQVFVYGEVNKPMAVPFREGMTVHQAIIEAGGFTEEASKSRVKVTREEKDGSWKKFKVNLNNARNLGWKLKPGDTITVPKRIL
jgi:polysaccharide export outer membrane protein